MSGHVTLVLTRLSAAAALATVGSVAGLATSSAATPAPTVIRTVAPAVAHPLPGLTDCGQGKPVVRRRAFIIFCGDAGEIAGKLHWTRLTATTGTAIGIARANQCTPTCAAGHFVSYRARYGFSRVRRINGAPAFTEVYITYLGERTPYGHRHQTDRLLDGSNVATA
jgi:hypothetical protein